MPNREELLRRQKALGDFGEFVLDNEDLQPILDEACQLIADALDVDLAKIIEIDRKTDTGLIRAGVGWKPGVVGRERIDLSARSSEAFAIETSEPVVTQDIEEEDRFHFPEFLRDHGVVAIVNVPIILPGRQPWGLLQVDARERRDFDEQDIEFLKTYAMVVGPVIHRLQTLADLEETDKRLSLILDNARGFTIVLSDLDDRVTDWLADSEQIFGWSADEIVGKPASTLFTPEDRESGQPQWELDLARRDGASPNVRWHMRSDGSRVYLDGQTLALQDSDGAIRGYAKIAQDVTDRHRSEERQAVLLAELQHRVRNVLAMVRSLVRRTLTGAQSIDEVSEQIEGRIESLARTQTLLTRALGVGVDLEKMIREELEAQAAQEDRVTIDGPPVELPPKAAEVVTLVIHELATNAAKYGALRQDGGSLAVSWTVDEEQEPPCVRLTWRESGIIVPAADQRRSGFGTELISRRVPYELGGSGGVSFLDGGVEGFMEFPLRESASILQTTVPVASAA